MSERTLLLTVDCGETTCDECETLDGEICELFGEVTENDEVLSGARVAQCMAAAERGAALLARAEAAEQRAQVAEADAARFRALENEARAFGDLLIMAEEGNVALSVSLDVLSFSPLADATDLRAAVDQLIEQQQPKEATT